MIWIIIIVVLYIGYEILKAIFGGSDEKKITYTNSDGLQKSETLKRRESRKFLSIEKPEDFEITPEIKNVLEDLEDTKRNIFLTGKAGTGKSTLLRYFRATTKKNHAVIAPTGVAAINVQGQTIHSFFSFGIDIAPNRVRYLRPDKQMVLRNLDTLIIDEISMVRADLLECVDKSLRLNRRIDAPFGGVQIIAIGDPYQLPPVVKTDEMKFFNKVYGGPYFFNSQSYKRANFKKLELHKVYRQKDDLVFIDILNAARVGEITEEHINILNKKSQKKPSPLAIKLVTTRALASLINTSEMKKLPGEERLYRAQVIGDFKEKDAPTEIELILKEGARVMLLNNDKNGRWVNGDVGQVIGMTDVSIKVKFDDDTYDDVDLNSWDNIKFTYDEDTGKVEPEVVGQFIQFPLKPAWALTIHKSQGKTYDYVHIDFGGGTFAAGQAYVALSRCTSLDGLTFEVPILKEDILIDDSVKLFMTNKNMLIKEDEVLKIAKPVAIDIQISEKTPHDGNITKSDLNKMKFFIDNSEKYATGTQKANEKVEYLKHIVDKYKHTIDESTINSFETAIEKYNKKLSNL